MTRAILLSLFTLMATNPQTAAQEMLDGTWKLVSSKRTTETTGATVDTFGPNPRGYIMYGKDGHMMVLITRSDRPKPDSIEKITDEQRQRLFASMLAYAGTDKFDGKVSSMTSISRGTKCGMEPCRSEISRRTAIG